MRLRDLFVAFLIFAVLPPSGYSQSPVYRFWSDENQHHFYTISSAEKDYVINNYMTKVWRYEGIGYRAFARGSEPISSTPVYRFWSDQHQAHFYTASEKEKDYVIANYPEYVWRYEGIAFYVFSDADDSPEAKPVYRFWSDEKQGHFYTISEAEKNFIIDNYPPNVWRYEGIAWYAYPRGDDIGFDLAPVGLWRGARYSAADQRSYKVFAYLSGSWMWVVSENNTLSFGSVTLTDSSLFGSLAVWGLAGESRPESDYLIEVGSVQVNGRFSGPLAVGGTYNSTFGDSGSFELAYDALFERDASLSLLTGTWTSPPSVGPVDPWIASFPIPLLGTVMVTASFDEFGLFYATMDIGCVFSGFANIPDGRYNNYQVDVTVGSCPGIDGSYQGFAFLLDYARLNDGLFLFFQSSDGRFAAGLLVRQ